MTPPRKLRVAVLMGGPSSEHDVSIASGLQVLQALDRSLYDIVPVVLERDGRWRLGAAPASMSLETSASGERLPGGCSREAGASAPAADSGSLSPGGQSGVEALRGEAAVDVAFLALHGAYGEDGCIQGLLRLAGIPFTGSEVLASALAMDKLKTKEIYAFHSIPVAQHFVIWRQAWRQADAAGRDTLASAALSVVGLPCVVKPVVGGSSFATSLVDGTQGAASARAAFEAAVDTALDTDTRALVEERLAGTEVTCAVLGGGACEQAEALPVTEIVPQGGSFFDFHAKYSKGASHEITPARLPEGLTARVQEFAIRAHEALGCEGMSRTDFIIRDGVPHALETNTIPGMTATSLLPQAAAAAGIPFPRLLDRLIQSALLRHRS